jgi:hypothetical protein
MGYGAIEQGKNQPGDGWGSPPMAREGHPSREAHKQPQYIVMRYICKELLMFMSYYDI